VIEASDGQVYDVWARKTLLIQPFCVAEIPGDFPDDARIAVLAHVTGGKKDIHDYACEYVRLSPNAVVALLPTGSRRANSRRLALELRVDGDVADVIEMRVRRSNNAGLDKQLAALLGWPGSSALVRSYTAHVAAGESPQAVLAELRQKVREIGDMLRRQVELVAKARARTRAIGLVENAVGQALEKLERRQRALE